MTLEKYKNSIEIAVPAGMIFIGILIVAVCLMPILLTQNVNLWWDVINYLDIMAYYIILVYLLFFIGILFIVAGTVVLITHDKNAD